MFKSMLYKSLKDTKVKITPTCFGSQRNHHQGVMTCTLTEITCNVSQIFIMCVVGVWQHNMPNTHDKFLILIFRRVLNIVNFF